MSVFGSRNEDPLLQNDPLVPSSDEDETSPDESSSTDDAADGQDASGSETTAANGTPQAGGGVFGEGGSPKSDAKDGHASSGGRAETRIIVHSIGEADREPLTAVNRALDDGWRLDRIETRGDSIPEREGEREDPYPEFALSLAFVLRRPTDK